MAMHHSDLILAVGARFDDRVTNGVDKFCPTARIVHIDIDPASISKTIQADVPIVGPAKVVLEDMVQLVKDSKNVRMPMPLKPGGNKSMNGVVVTVVAIVPMTLK